MAKYAIFVDVKDETFSRMADNPRPAADRVAVVAKAIEQVGGTLDADYWMFGPYDAAVYDPPDLASAAAVSIAVCSTTAFDVLEMLELFVVDHLSDILTKAGAVRSAYTRREV